MIVTNHSEKQVTYINLYMDCMVNGQRLSQSDKLLKKKKNIRDNPRF